MAKRKSSDAKTVKLTHINGATVQVNAEKEERLVASGLFTKPTSGRSSKSSD